MTRAKIIFSFAWILLALYVCIESFKLGLGTFHSPEPGFMPFLVGVIIGLLGLIILFIEWKHRQAEIDWKTVKWRKIAIILLGILFYAVLLRTLGYLLTTFLIMGLFFKIFGLQRWTFIILYSLLATLAIYLIFDVWLQCQFPRGFLRM
jgi:putative tricarboxylic transport membrane protein